MPIGFYCFYPWTYEPSTHLRASPPALPHNTFHHTECHSEWIIEQPRNRKMPSFWRVPRSQPGPQSGRASLLTALVSLHTQWVYQSLIPLENLPLTPFAEVQKAFLWLLGFNNPTFLWLKMWSHERPTYENLYLKHLMTIKLQLYRKLRKWGCPFNFAFCC